MSLPAIDQTVAQQAFINSITCINISTDNQPDAHRENLFNPSTC